MRITKMARTSAVPVLGDPAIKHQRITQRRIAELAGVSQATVSLVLNGKADDAASRIPEETRRRVLEVIRETTYVADPAARRLAGGSNKILGVFTYEPAFPSQSQDFYTPLLTGIEAQAESIGCDLLMFTSAPVTDGRRRIFHENNRLRLADGCLLLGLEMDDNELSRLAASDFPFVAIGRRETPGVPYVGADYAAGTADLVAQALEQGHDRFFLLARKSSGESVTDRRRGFHDALSNKPVSSETRITTGADLQADWAAIKAFNPTVLFIEYPAHATALYALALAEGLRVPEDLSMVVLGECSAPSDPDIDFTRLSPPRTALGSTAVTLLARIIASDEELPDSELRTLLDCPTIPGSTLTKARRKP
ncbi:LacI family DNA-binding transcriptional regulator [Arthrobacter citreus]|uniref:LacI family DNA-binding transcriptional regulator n=1 Tax=Arthrobacter citreus TaxID=1670 RepID=A0ABZ2ZS22_9MICC